MLLSEFIRTKKKMVAFKKALLQNEIDLGRDITAKDINDQFIDSEIKTLARAFIFEHTPDQEMWELLNIEFKGLRNE